MIFMTAVGNDTNGFLLTIFLVNCGYHENTLLCINLNNHLSRHAEFRFILTIAQVEYRDSI
jgi:hypothetical protein